MDLEGRVGQAGRAAVWTALLALGAAGAARAQDAPRPIQDNSFLMEEAYNQESRVVQHISTFARERGSDGWSYTFTQEWPFFGQKNQLSYTIPLSRADSDGTGTGIGDVALNYRYQLVGSGDTRVAVAPRLSVILPTGSESKGRGTGGTGVQLNLPLSFMATDRLALHSNAGVTYTPRAINGTGAHAATQAFNLGQSAILLATPTLNFMLESVWTRTEMVVGEGVTGDETSFLVSPGVRWAINAPSGLQIVPGLAVPIGVGPSRGERSLFLYLSFEHPF
jgi:hypothetical protein